MADSRIEQQDQGRRNIGFRDGTAKSRTAGWLIQEWNGNVEDGGVADSGMKQQSQGRRNSGFGDGTAKSRTEK